MKYILEVWQLRPSNIQGMPHWALGNFCEDGSLGPCNFRKYNFGPLVCNNTTTGSYHPLVQIIITQAAHQIHSSHKPNPPLIISTRSNPDSQTRPNTLKRIIKKKITTHTRAIHCVSSSPIFTSYPNKLPRTQNPYLVLRNLSRSWQRVRIGVIPSTVANWRPLIGQLDVDEDRPYHLWIESMGWLRGEKDWRFVVLIGLLDPSKT